MSQRTLLFTGTCAGAVAAGLLLAGLLGGDPPQDDRGTARPFAGAAGQEIRFGAFLGSGPEGVRRMAGLRGWLDGRVPRVGHTYLPGDLWSNIEGRPEFLRPWARWRQGAADRLFVLNVPMLARNEANVPDAAVARLLAAGADGRYDRHFRTLAARLVRLGIPDTVVVLGWEMNGTTYTHRCAPDPDAWKAYWRRIVSTMREVPGQKFRFDFAPARGRDAIGWTACYPGDRYVDIIGMDSYDQGPGADFDDQISQPYGLQHQVDFAAAHGKPVSYPEWGLFRRGDNAEYTRRMLAWITEQRPLYHTISDYCPHGVWQCREHPESSEVFRAWMAAPDGGDGGPSRKPGWKPAPEPGSCLNLRDWLQRRPPRGPFCLRPGPGPGPTGGRG